MEKQVNKNKKAHGMEINFGMYDTPHPSGREGKKTKHARALTLGTKTLEDICYILSDRSSITSSDIKGVLDGLVSYLTETLQEGYNIELEGLGHFSLSLKSQQKITKKGKETILVEVDGVNFRCSPKLKSALKRVKPQKVKAAEVNFNMETRRKRMLDYLQEYSTVNATEYARLNACSHYRASLDLKQFLTEGVIGQIGRHTHKNYMLAGNKEE